jgi:hypothetical protein
MSGDGDYSYPAPSQIKVRWESRRELFAPINDQGGPRGQEQYSRAVIYTDQEVVVDGLLYLGSINDLDSDLQPGNLEAFKILNVEHMPNLRNNLSVWKVFL